MEEQFVSWQYSHTYVVHEEEPGTVQRKATTQHGARTYVLAPCCVAVVYVRSMRHVEWP